MNDPIKPELKAPPSPVSSGEAKVCPSCKRKLLTQTSILCNWCGAKIDDEEFLARAAAQRQALDEQDRAQIETVAQEEARYGVFGRLKRQGKTKPGGSGKTLL
jgi:predicted amidophosphoribosyltransferase